MSARIRIGVIFGGRSGEHEVSLRSARSIIDALDPAKYDVVPIGITHDGRWVAVDDVNLALSQGVEQAAGTRVALVAEPGHNGFVAVSDGANTLDTGKRLDVDVVFPVLHGTFGEDGTLQGLLEMAGIAYVGSGVTGSSAGMDKIVMKDVFKANGLPLIPDDWFLRTEWERNPEAIEQRLEQRLGYPQFVKPANLGSSVGISKARNRAELSAAIAEAAQYDRRIVCESGVPSTRELECAVLGNDDPKASVVGEIVPGAEFYDYATKYLTNTSSLHIPAPIDEGLSNRIREMAVKAFRALDLAGLSRVDFFLDGESGALYLNEVNTLPGFTSISMYPKLWEATGVGYASLVDQLVTLALERHSEKRRSRFTFGAAAPSAT
ncbi:MAG: D-alanine--D-alanine ligase [Proteobacteria bacterium]|nr:D-alanine--D-alanine ligase [Pseudomonadota bacterium]